MKHLRNGLFLFMILVVCVGCSKAVGINSFGPVSVGENKMEVGQELPFVVDITNPSSLPVTFEWVVTKGVISSPNKNSPAATYKATEIGAGSVTVFVNVKGVKVAQSSFAVEIVAPQAVAVAPSPLPPTLPATVAPTNTPIDTATPLPTLSATFTSAGPTTAPTKTPLPTYTVQPAAKASVCGVSPSRARLADTGHLNGKVTISSPQNGDAGLPGGTAIEVSGTYQDLSEGAALWLFVYSPLAKRYYPQSRDGCKGAQIELQNGRWSVPVYLAAGECHELVVVLTDSEATRFLADKSMAWCQAKSWPGLTADELEGGFTEKASIEVRTK